MARRRREDEDMGCFAEVKSDRLKFVLYLVREARLAFEAAAASRWVTWWTCSVVVGGSASWLIKTHLFR